MVVALSLLSGAALSHAAPAVPTAGDSSRVLRLRTGAVDTLQRENLARSGTALRQDAWHVMQLDGPMTPQRRARLEAAGIVPGQYLPRNAWIVRIDEAGREALSAMEFVSWLGEYDRAWKWCPRIGTAEFSTPDRIALAAEGRLKLCVQLFASADLDRAREAIEAAGATWIDVQSRPGGTTALVEMPATAVEALRDIAAVQFVEEAAEPQPRNVSTAWICQTSLPDNNRLWDMGLHGENQIAGLIDWDVYEPHCAFDDPVNPIGPDHRKILAYYGSGGCCPAHGTHVAGVYVANDLSESNPAFRGMAYESKLVFTNATNPLTTVNLFSRLEIHHNDGARVHSNSWGGNDQVYNAWSRDIDDFSYNYEDDVVLVATINNGPVLNPENAKNCIAVNATQDTPNQHNKCLGGVGPTADGRQKPDVYGVGCGSISVANNTACSQSLSLGGTSYATPAVAGLCILTRQYFEEGYYPGGAPDAGSALAPSGALIKAMIINSAVDMTGIAGYFNPQEGWGRVRMDDPLYFAGDTRKLHIEDVRHAQGLSTGVTDTTFVQVASPLEPLKITLVWHDAPAAIAAEDTPVNNVDLLVTDPLGVQYKGNVISGFESATGGIHDTLNNAEQVIRLFPVAGQWQIDVIGTAVNVGTQGYALVVTGDLTPTCTKGDVNQDGSLNGEDVASFVNVVLDGGTSAEECAADMNSAGGPGIDDVDPFVTALLGA